MPPQVVNIPGVGPVSFPDTMSDDDVIAASQQLWEQRTQPVAQDEPGDFWGGFQKGQADYYRNGAGPIDAVKRIGGAFLRSVNPLNTVKDTLADLRKRSADDLALQEQAKKETPESLAQDPFKLARQADAQREGPTLGDVLDHPGQMATSVGMALPEIVGGVAGGYAQGKGTAGLMNYAGPRLKSTAVSANERMLKLNKSMVENLSPKRWGNTIAERSRNISEALLQDPNGQISKSGADAFDAATGALQSQVDDLIAQNPEARGSTQHIVDALAQGRDKVTSHYGSTPAKRQYDAVAQDVLADPRLTKTKRGMAADPSDFFNTTPTRQPVGRELLIPRARAATVRPALQSTYRHVGDQAYGSLQGPEIEAYKSSAAGARNLVNEAIPAAEPINADIARRIDMGTALDEAAFRSGKHDPLGVGEKIILAEAATGNPRALGWSLPISMLNRPGLGSPVARGAYQFGNALNQTSNQRLIDRAVRAAVFANIGH